MINMFNKIKKLFRRNKVNQNSNASPSCVKYRQLASDGCSCLGYSANWTDDAEECKKCERFVRYEYSQ